ncbi:TPA: tail fiber protein [Aeromonas hydrophila subsp. hydrophila]|nr:tail fiber protein [Aeromonas hydrophila]
MAGIAPVKGDLNQVAKAIQSIAFSAYPVGSPIPWPTAVPPTGFLAMTGQSFSSTTYPRLALAYPTLVLPDMRAEFIRGWDGGRGVDPSRVLLSSQGDAIRNIPASFDIHGENSNGDPVGSAIGAFSYEAGTGGSSPTFSVLTGTPKNNGRVTFSAASVVPVASENRPRNIPFNFIVRAA